MPRNSSTPPLLDTAPEIPDAGAQELAARLSAQVGEQVQLVDPRWRQFARQGVIIEVHVSRERFKLRMTRKDMGIEFPDEDIEDSEGAKAAKAVDAILVPGELYFIPKKAAERIRRLDELARENVQRWGFKTFWGWWVPLTAFERWKLGAPVVEGVERKDRDRGNDELRALFEAEKESLLARYDELVAQAQAGWVSLASSNWERLDGTPVARQLPNFEDKEAWVRERVQALTARLLTVEQIRRKFTYSHEVSMIPTAEQVQLDLLRAGDRRLETAEREMLADLEAAARATVRGGVDQFMTEVRGALSSKVFEAVAAALKVVRGRGGKLGRNSSIALTTMLDSVENLMFWDESGTFRANIEELRVLVGQGSEGRSGEDLTRVLTALGAETRLTLMELDQTQERLGIESELSDDPTKTSLSSQVLTDKARRLADELGFVEDEELLVGMIRREGDADLGDDEDDDQDDGPVGQRRLASDPDDLWLDDETEAPPARVGAEAELAELVF